MKKYFLIIITALCATELQAQQTSAKLFEVKEISTSPAKPLVFEDNPIVDINSRLSVVINPKALLVSLPASKKSNPVLTSKLATLIELLKDEQQILGLIKPATANASVNRDSLRAYSHLMRSFYDKLKLIPEFRTQADGFFRTAITQIRSNTFDTLKYPSPQAYVISHIDSVMNQIAADISTAKDVSAYSIQLQAYIQTKTVNNQKIHIDNFDSFSQGEFYEVPRWVTSFSASDTVAFNQVAQLSQALNSALSGNFRDMVKLIPDTLNSYICIKNLISEAKNDEAALATQTANTATGFVSSIEARLNTLLAAMQNFQQQKIAVSGNPLQQFNQATGPFLSLAVSFPATIDSLKALVNTAEYNANTTAKKLYNDAMACVDILKRDAQLVKGVYQGVANLLQPIQNSASTAQQVTGNVYDININQIPAIGYIDLKYSGKRSNGDFIQIKLVTRSQDDVKKNLPGLILEEETIEMQQIAFYSESNIAVILASPIGSNSQVTLKNKFQFAPSGSLVVKFGSRTSRLWNTINPGLGFNISTPDFNLDGSPDISYGGVFTLFHNIVSVGWDYNTKTSSPFWFFGLSLPFTTFGLPAGNVQTQKQ